ncbi:MAG: hypothetical protein R2874_13040 [Desulfobacterales bacterium]
MSNAWLDGLATAITVMGVQNGMALLEQIGIEGLILYELNGKIAEIVSPGLALYYQRR